MEAITSLDEWLVLFINQPAGRIPILDRIAIDVADSTLLKGGLFLAFFWWLWFRGEEHKQQNRRAVVVALCGGVVAAAVSRVLQVGLPFHQRPLHTSSLAIRVPLGVDPEVLNTFSSFPSDHAVLFFALSVPIWTQSRLLGIAAGLWALLVICLSRISLSERHSRRRYRRHIPDACDAWNHQPNDAAGPGYST